MGGPRGEPVHPLARVDAVAVRVVLWQVPPQEAAVREYPEHGVDHASIVESPADLRPRSGGRRAAIGPLRVTQLELPSRPSIEHTLTNIPRWLPARLHA